MEVLDIFKMSPLKGIHRVSRWTPYGSCDIEKCKHVILKLGKKVKSFLCFPLQFYQVVRLPGCQWWCNKGRPLGNNASPHSSG